jgi:lipoprotein-anchoring transpeptidase ErfK/SrfK
MKVDSTAKKITVWFVSALLFAFAAASVWAIVSDYESLGVVAKGVTLAGHALGGLTAPQVRTAIDDAVSTPMMQPLSVTGDAKSWTLDPRGIVTIDANAMVAQAYAPSLNATIVTRLKSRLVGDPIPADVKPDYSIDTSSVAHWVAETAVQVDRNPISAKRTVVKYAIRITPAVYGATVVQTAAVDAIATALSDDVALSSASRTASLPVVAVKPKVVESSFKTAIVVSLSQTLVKLYKGAKLVKTYRCAPGQPAWPTPTGDFTIVNKQSNAPWINPNSPWSASMPPIIPGGPGNPMGDRKIAINYPGVFLHGIPPSEYGSIGTHASHGCMRMMPASIHDLFGRVRIGDPVYIRP